ncbi:MAG: hypothetical protein AB1564_14515 [Chloroflexota bacterium]
MTDPIQILAELASKERTPEETAALVAELARTLPKDFVDEAYKNGLAGLAHQDSPAGFAAFYELLYGFKPPRHIVREIDNIFRAHEEGIGALTFAWRGSWKTVSISETFTAWRIGLEPTRTNIIVSANDDSAEKITKAIAAIIEFHPEWKRVFPNVVPDTGRWSVEGFYVIDSNVPREQWTAMQAGVIDPTLVGGGYESSRLIGKHPSGVLCIDDIHDLKNSSSERERKLVVDTLTKTILKTTIKEKDKLVTWLLAIGTPWSEDDGYHEMKKSGNFAFISIPAMRKAKEDEGVFIDGKHRNGVVFEDIVGWWELEWPERFGPASIVRERADGRASFWQMIMLDIHTAKEGGLRYHLYPHDKIDLTWPAGGGCDFATLKADGKKDPGRDMFSLCFGVKTPTNQLVVTDGVIEQVTQAKAETMMNAASTRFKSWRGGIFEGDGAGEQFYMNYVSRNQGSLWRIEKTKGVPKAIRQEREMGVWLENGTVLISDADTPYLNALRKALDDFPDGNNDIRDGLYWLCRTFPETLVVPTKLRDSLPRPERPSFNLGSVWSQI